MSTSPSTAPEDPRVIEHRLQQHSYFMPDSELKNLPENKHPQSNADGGSSTAASQGNPTSPLTAYSQYGASVTSKQQTRTARSHPSSDESGSIGSGVGPSMTQRRTNEKARRAQIAQNLSNNDRPATRSTKRSARKSTSGGEEEGPSESQGMEPSNKVEYGSGLWSKGYKEQDKNIRVEGLFGIPERQEQGRHLRNRIIE
jgi:hypothetical protein